MIFEGSKTEYDRTHIIETEVVRLTKKYNKEFLDCNDLMGIIGVGRDNVRMLMRSEGFPIG